MKTLDRFFWPQNIREAKKQAEAFKSRETLVYLTPETFVKLASPIGLPDKEIWTDELENVIEAKGFRDVPYFKTQHMGKGEFRITGHEGRHRSIAFIRKGMGQKLMPVRIIDSTIRWAEDDMLGEIITLIPQTGRGTKYGARIPKSGELKMTAVTLKSQSKGEESQLVITGTPDGVHAAKKFLDAIGKKASVGAGVTVKMESGDGTEDVGYVDGDGNAHFTCGKVESVSEVASESRGKGSARSKMLKMVMPLLSRQTGEKLAAAIESNNVGAMRNAMNEVVRGMEKKMELTKRKKKK